MAKIRQTQAEAIYDSLKKTIHNCIKENNWEFYKGKALIVAKQIKDIKNYIENVPFPVARDYKWAGDLEVFEAAYYKMIYYKDLWSASDWILYTLQNETRKEIRIITIKHVNLFIEALLSFQLIKTYRGQISKIINANVSGKQLLLMYEHIRTLTDGFREKLDDTLYITESYKLNEGFYNPFDNDENKSEDIVSNNKDIEERLIRKIKVYNSKNQEGGIKYKNNGVYANTTFYKDDVIEEAPVYILHDSDLYSANVRQLTFMIDSSKRIFGIPMGMATVARYADEAKKEANIDYEFDPDNGGKIVVTDVKYDAQGHITGKGTTTMTMPATPTSVSGNAGSASKVNNSIKVDIQI